MMILLGAFVAFIVALLVTHQICDPASRLHILDHPNERSLHTQAVPRTGGVAILMGIASAFLLLYGFADFSLATVGWITSGAAVVALVSLIDDRQSLSVRLRLLGQVVSAGLVVAGGLWLHESELPGADGAWAPTIGVVLSMLYLIWMVNLYNFMDGMDGFAGGMAVIGFGTFVVLGTLVGNSAFIATSLIIASAAAGFLVFNFPPARIFMGDGGSATLGMLAGGLSLWGVRDGVFPFWVALLVFSPFIVDATVTLLRRLGRGERVWQAHKSHYYQRLVQFGWGHKKTVLYEYVLMLACGFSALLAQYLNPQGQVALILFWCLVYLLLMIGVYRMERMKKP